MLDEVREVLRIKNYSYRTEKSYVRWIRSKFILFHNKRHPRDMAEPEIKQFLNYLADKEKVAASTQNQALSAILFLYKEVLHKEIGFVQNIHWAKKPVKLPVVLTNNEVLKVLNHLEGKYKLAVGFIMHWMRQERRGTDSKLVPVVEESVHTRGEEDFKRLEKLVVDTARQIDHCKRKGDFPKIPRERCPFWCPFMDYCWGKKKKLIDTRVDEKLRKV